MRIRRFLWVVSVSVLLLASSLYGESRSVFVNWNPNPESDIAGYNVYRSDLTNSEYIRLNQNLIETIGFTDATASSGNRYFYVVTAVNSAALESDFSAYATADIICPGDVNGDRQRNVIDSVRILSYIVGNIDLREEERLAADVTQSGAVDVGDSVRLLNHIVGSINLGPCP